LAVVTLRPMLHKDREKLVRLTASTGFFRPEEVVVAREVLEESAKKGADGSGYHIFVAESDRPIGWVCFGPTPMTRGTWDLYWIAVDSKEQGKGVGRRLMALAEKEVRHRGGRLVIVETSSLEKYEPTRRFYRSLGYAEMSAIPDFYDIGDSRVTFAKTLSREVSKE
jgi:ribosomal protein S18 acetylase RimI-like enzyme